VKSRAALPTLIAEAVVGRSRTSSINHGSSHQSMALFSFTESMAPGSAFVIESHSIPVRIANMSRKEELIPDGTTIRWCRYEKGWTQEQLASIAGVNKKTIENMEDGKPARPTTLTKVAEALNVQVDRLLRFSSSNSRKPGSPGLLTWLAKLEKRQQAFETYVRAEELRKDGWLHEAEFLYQEVYHLTPENEHGQNALIGIAKIQRQRTNYKAALDTLDRLLERNPQNDRAQYNRACYLNLSGASKKEVLRELKKTLSMVSKPLFYQEYAAKDRDLQNLWADDDFKRIVGSTHL